MSTSSPSPQTDDLTELVDLAQSKLRQQSQVKRLPPERKGHGKFILLGLIWATAIGLWGWQLWPAEPKESEIRAELDSLIGEARGSIDRHLKDHNTLPDQLPAGAPALVLSYTVVDPSAKPPVYALEGRIGSVSQRWTNGKSE